MIELQYVRTGVTAEAYRWDRVEHGPKVCVYNLEEPEERLLLPPPPPPGNLPPPPGWGAWKAEEARLYEMYGVGWLTSLSLTFHGMGRRTYYRKGYFEDVRPFRDGREWVIRFTPARPAVWPARLPGRP